MLIPQVAESIVTDPAPALVGRNRELNILEQVLEAGCAGSPQIVFVTGEAGIGKTSLLAELLRQAEGRGCLGSGEAQPNSSVRCRSA
jgi:Cdc6-like AAA superfamily ATPase